MSTNNATAVHACGIVVFERCDNPGTVLEDCNEPPELDTLNVLPNGSQTLPPYDLESRRKRIALNEILSFL